MNLLRLAIASHMLNFEHNPMIKNAERHVKRNLMLQRSNSTRSRRFCTVPPRALVGWFHESLLILVVQLVNNYLKTRRAEGT